MRRTWSLLAAVLLTGGGLYLASTSGTVRQTEAHTNCYLSRHNDPYTCFAPSMVASAESLVNRKPLRPVRVVTEDTQLPLTAVVVEPHCSRFMGKLRCNPEATGDAIDYIFGDATAVNDDVVPVTPKFVVVSELPGHFTNKSLKIVRSVSIGQHSGNVGQPTPTPVVGYGPWILQTSFCHGFQLRVVSNEDRAVVHRIGRDVLRFSLTRKRCR